MTAPMAPEQPIDITAAGAHATADNDASAGADESFDERLHLLVVDDDEVDRLAVRRVLGRSSMQVDITEARTAAETLAALADNRFHCILLDYDIPGVDGLTLLRSIRRSGVQTPVVMLTGVGDEQVAVELMKAGAVDYLPKAALSPQRLSSSVRYALELTRARKAAENAERELLASVQRSRELAEEAQRAHERTDRLQKLTGRLAAVMTIDEVARLFVDEVCTTLEVSTAVVGLLDDERRFINTVAAIGYGPEELQPWLRYDPFAFGPTGEVLSTGTPRWFRSHEEVLSQYPALHGSPGLQSQSAIALLPLDVGAGAFGIVTLGFPQERDFSPADMALVVTFAQQCAQAIERSRLYEAERVARLEAVEANRAKSEFLARMSHDLRTPLNAIGGYTQLLELGVHGEVTGAQLDALGRIRRAQEHLLTLINDILGFARIEAGQVHLEITAVRIDDTLRHVMELIEPQTRAQQLDFEFRCDAEGVEVLADRERLVQILLNLLSNAVKFTPAPGTVTLECEVTERQVVVHVRDTGRGIQSERLESIFDPFVQEARLPRDSAGGVGLGLAISRDLAQRMSATLTVESVPGEGSTFTLRLPKYRAA